MLCCVLGAAAAPSSCSYLFVVNVVHVFCDLEQSFNYNSLKIIATTRKPAPPTETDNDASAMPPNLPSAMYDLDLRPHDPKVHRLMLLHRDHLCQLASKSVY